jgi:hypothetical protein
LTLAIGSALPWVLAIGSYVFQPARLLATIVTVTVVVVLLTTLTMFVDLERNEVLSALAKTEPKIVAAGIAAVISGGTMYTVARASRPDTFATRPPPQRRTSRRPIETARALSTRAAARSGRSVSTTLLRLARSIRRATETLACKLPGGRRSKASNTNEANSNEL